MSFELIYTSVPRGLKPGSRGFCTVAQSDGLPAAAAMICESLSGYTHLYDLQDSRYAHNPVAWSHLVARAQGSSFSILSRVSALRADYTGRTNKIAHHRILSLGERQPCGPAEILRRPGTFREDWNEEPSQLKPVRLPGIQEPAGCRADLWRQVAGDAGLAGEIAQAFLDNPARPCFLVYEPGTDVLGLFAEALTLLPSATRWQVGFTTYFSGLPAGMDCAWRGCPSGSEAAETAQRSTSGLVINLTNGTVTGVRPASLALAEAARTGIRPAIQPDSVHDSREHEIVSPGVDASQEASSSRSEGVSHSPKRGKKSAIEYLPPAQRKSKLGRNAAVASLALLGSAAVAVLVLLRDAPPDQREGDTTIPVSEEQKPVQNKPSTVPEVASEKPSDTSPTTNSVESVEAPTNPPPVPRRILVKATETVEYAKSAQLTVIDKNGKTDVWISDSSPGIDGNYSLKSKNNNNKDYIFTKPKSGRHYIDFDRMPTNVLAFALYENSNEWYVVKQRLPAPADRPEKNHVQETLNLPFGQLGGDGKNTFLEFPWTTTNLVLSITLTPYQEGKLYSTDQALVTKSITATVVKVSATALEYFCEIPPYALSDEETKEKVQKQKSIEERLSRINDVIKQLEEHNNYFNSVKQQIELNDNLVAELKKKKKNEKEITRLEDEIFSNSKTSQVLAEKFNSAFYDSFKQNTVFTNELVNKLREDGKNYKIAYNAADMTLEYQSNLRQLQAIFIKPLSDAIVMRIRELQKEKQPFEVNYARLHLPIVYKPQNAQLKLDDFLLAEWEYGK